MTPAPLIAATLAFVTMQNVPPRAKAACDLLLVVGGALSTVAGWLPPIAALVSIIWGGLNIYLLVRDRFKRKP